MLQEHALITWSCEIVRQFKVGNVVQTNISIKWNIPFSVNVPFEIQYWASGEV